MIGEELVRRLEPDWQETLDAVATGRGWPTSRDVAALGRDVARLSAAYNDGQRARATVREAGAARLGFAFARDVPKGAAAVRELVALRVLRPQGAVRVLDIGAGLGATTWGVARALAAASPDAEVDATWVEPDEEAGSIAREIVSRRTSSGAAARVGGSPRLRATCVSRRVDDLAGLGAFDLVLLGNLLSELDVGTAAEARVAAHARLLATLLRSNVRPDGAVVVIEPALRDRTRHLHLVRDAAIGLGAAVFAPCLHQASCPALAHEGDWCHEDLAVDLPPWLVPVARAAGLRFQGLTFSYLVLRRGGASLRDCVGSRQGGGASLLRVVSQPMASKGKCEVYLCGAFGGDVSAPARERVVRLKRDEPALPAPGEPRWAELSRGDILTVEPFVPRVDSAGAARLGRQARVRLVPGRE